MRVLSRVQQSRAKFATVVSAALIAVTAAGVGFAPAASASTAGARPAAVTAGAIKPDKLVTYNGGKYSTIADCVAALDEIRTNPYFSSGSCVYKNGAYYMTYTLDLPECVIIAGRTDVIAGRAVEPAC